MSDFKNISEADELTLTLNEKRNLYNQMLSENKEFEMVKGLFIEIRELEKCLQELQSSS